MLLPLDTHPSNEPVTVEFIKDHIALCDGANRKYAPIITLSGLRGVLDEYVSLIIYDLKCNKHNTYVHPLVRHLPFDRR